MSNTHGPMLSEDWLANLFSPNAMRDGQVAHHNLRDVDSYIGREALISELNRRGFRAVGNAGQNIIFCNREPIRRVL